MPYANLDHPRFAFSASQLWNIFSFFEFLPLMDILKTPFPHPAPPPPLPRRHYQRDNKRSASRELTYFRIIRNIFTVILRSADLEDVSNFAMFFVER